MRTTRRSNKKAPLRRGLFIEQAEHGGHRLFHAAFTQNFDPTKLLGLISVLAAMAIVLNEIVRRAEVHFGRWRTD